MEAAPKGIDVYFDNVGGDHLDAAFACARNQARFAICGMIEDYNTGSNHAFRYIMRMIAARIRMQGFLYFDFLSDMPRSEARRVGNRCGRTCSFRWLPEHYKINNKKLKP